MPKQTEQNVTGVFSSRITELRKSRNLSQKQASKDLGISQALLSHYENGVRECGLGFVVKIANYYNVTCDYLLGSSNNMLDINSNPQLADIPEDSELSTSTIVRAAVTSAVRMKKEEDLTDYILKVYSIATYFVIYGGVKRGVLPVSWMGDNPLNMDTAAYLGTTVNKALHDIRSGTKKNTKEKVPACIDTVSTWINDYLNVSIASLL